MRSIFSFLKNTLRETASLFALVLCYDWMWYLKLTINESIIVYQTTIELFLSVLPDSKNQLFSDFWWCFAGVSRFLYVPFGVCKNLKTTQWYIVFLKNAKILAVVLSPPKNDNYVRLCNG
jgi:hypothetical protein